MSVEPIITTQSKRGVSFSWLPALTRLLREPAFHARLQQDRAVYGVILLTIVAGYSIALFSGLNPAPVLAGYFLQVLFDSVMAAAFMMFALIIVPAVLQQPGAPMKAARERVGDLGLAHITASFMLLTAMLNAHGAYTLLKRLLPVPYGFTWDKTFADFDRWLHFGTDPWRILQPLADNPVVMGVLQANYGAGWGVLIMAVLAWICMSPDADAIC